MSPRAPCAACGCAMKRIGEDVSEKLDYTPGVFNVERHIRGKWVCAKCQTLVQAPVPPHMIDKGMPTAGLLAQVLVAKYLDHLPLYRQEGIFERAGLAIPRSTLAQWVGACGVQLQPLVDALRASCWSATCCTPMRRRWRCSSRATARRTGPTSGATARRASMRRKAVVFDFAESRAGRMHASSSDCRATTGWRGKLVCDDYSGYKALLTMGVTEVGCLAHARRKFYDLWVNHKSPVAEEALKFFGQLYEVEREVQDLDADERRRIRQLQARPIADTLRNGCVCSDRR